ncbi:YHS domain-containing protein [Ferroplasma sp. Type II]|uniref:YHS domain-containing protein n=1 Tax=Ferroplasma sp. Type II TaxID=261388 RepID=UPI0025C62089|nr:YHS domain-containing protein [Ferroplasma sp. Type II]
MYVSEDSKIYSEQDGTRYYFCSQGCKDKFDEPDAESKNLKLKLMVAWPFSIAIMAIGYLFVFNLKTLYCFCLCSRCSFMQGSIFIEVPMLL